MLKTIKKVATLCLQKAYIYLKIHGKSFKLRENTTCYEKYIRITV